MRTGERSAADRAEQRGRRAVLQQVRQRGAGRGCIALGRRDRKSTRLNSSHSQISYAVFCLKKKTKQRVGTVHGQLSQRERRSDPAGSLQQFEDVPLILVGEAFLC